MINPVLKVEKKINADQTRLFRAWLDTENFSRWFLSGDPIVESVSIDPRPGGKFRIDMSLNGKIFPHEGEYQTIEEPTKLVFTWRSHATGGRDTLVTVTFTALSTTRTENSSGANQRPQTLVTLIHERLANEKEIQSHDYGWTHILDAYSEWFDEKG
ncbi:SRPBCC family protein [Leptospira stimsonii]|uniref:SRPBCC domain-containing protein n=1 Tax=Leptospira stimsonii TaxID=2202203 RepID=A0ABY2NCS6_9LEPT|nr:SRPBCC domain-containing protein [Leptospira stimsonii]TGK20405.1 SRPBCC domain-containing protein [Leptospira stimsonii]TGM21516.1 SRPBCC domain-containing protein [Leptospira stimsonii]